MRWASNPPRKNNIATETQAIHSESHQTLGEEPRTEAAMPCMMSRDEIREEVSTPMESLAKPKHIVRVAAWNVRTM